MDTDDSPRPSQILAKSKIVDLDMDTENPKISETTSENIWSQVSPELVKIIKSLFLNRYAQSVTLNGEIINDENHEETGYGIWVG